MNEHPILFNAQAVRAILAGTKTQTRKVIMPQPPREMVRAAVGITGWWVGWDADDNEVWSALCPYGVSGDMLWVRETFGLTPDEPPDGSEEPGIYYRADWDGTEPVSFSWRSSVLMPRLASRVTLSVTDVRVQRVQNVSEEDVLAEGITREDMAHYCWYWRPFQVMWNSVNFKRGYPWELNPWVWAITFKKERP